MIIRNYLSRINAINGSAAGQIWRWTNKTKKHYLYSSYPLCIRTYADSVHSDLLGIPVQNEDLKQSLDVFKNKNPQDWTSADWRKFYVNIRELRDSSNSSDSTTDSGIYDNRDIIYLAGQAILESWLSKGPKGKTLPALFYEEILQTLSGDPSPTKEHAELGLHIVDHMIDRNLKISRDILDMLFQLVLHQGDSFQAYKFACTALHLAESSSDGLNPRRLKFVARHLVQLHISSGNLEGALYSLLRISNQDDWGGNKNVKVKLNYNINEALLFSLLSQGDVGYASMLLNYMHAHGNVYARAWGMFISTAAELGDYEALCWARNAAIIPGRVVVDDWTYMKMAEVASKNGDYRMTRWCILRCKKREVIFPMITDTLRVIDQFVAPLIEAHAVNGNITKAFMFLERMKETCASVKLSYVPKLVEQLSSSEEYTKIALLRFKEVCANPNTSDALRTLMFNIICAGFIKSRTDAPQEKLADPITKNSSPSQVLILYEGLLMEYDIKPNLDTMLLFLHHAIIHNDTQLMMRISADCDACGITKDSGPLARLVNIFSKPGIGPLGS